MSSECEAFVEKHSPYDGTAYMVHLRMAMIANETHDYRLFVGDETMAKLCRCSIKSVQRARQQMIKDGYLIQTERAVGQRKAEYEFVFKVGSQNVHPLSEVGSHLVPSSKTSEESTLSTRTKENQSDVRTTINNRFEVVWKSYPRKIGKIAALKAFTATLKAKKAEIADLETAAHNYAMSRVGEDPKFTLHGATFFGPTERWRDWVDAPIGATLDDRARVARAEAEAFIQQKEREHEEGRSMPADIKASLKAMRGNL